LLGNDIPSKLLPGIYQDETAGTVLYALTRIRLGGQLMKAPIYKNSNSGITVKQAASSSETVSINSI
jgi:hypothetical protein